MPGVDPSLIPKVKPFTATWHTSPYPFISPTRPALSAAGRNIVITGGATGIGLAVAQSFARAGASSVSIIGRRLDKLTAAIPLILAAAPDPSAVKVHYEQADLISRDQATRAFTKITTALGPDSKIDVLVSNAGPDPAAIAGVTATVTDDNLWEAYKSTVLQAVHAIQAWLRFCPSGSGVLISTNTCFAHFPPVPGFGMYSIARATLLKFTDYVQVEHPHVRVVSTQPGWVATAANGFQKEAPDDAELPGNFYVWLASEEAGFLKGKFVWANWDAEELVARRGEIEGTKVLTMVLKGVDDNE
ncbi:putative short chain dehydrogenase [Echria macrotheca]|uniref:Short chain dehydrogenase n=1 Tax=Echria macrotheca TaxID=438768 RepID=A0AAJ0F4M2_9PEZI|nr:putative short chain dehydrogenase [Echria macrotheca]